MKEGQGCVLLGCEGLRAPGTLCCAFPAGLLLAVTGSLPSCHHHSAPIPPPSAPNQLGPLPGLCCLGCTQWGLVLTPSSAPTRTRHPPLPLGPVCGSRSSSKGKGLPHEAPRQGAVVLPVAPAF